MKTPVYNMKGEQVDTLIIDEQTLGGEINAALVKQAYVRYHANLRQGSARTRGRGEVQGSTRKIYKQKGTGRARMGANRTPIRKGGGHTFAKKKRRQEYHLDMPVKMRRKANRNALLAKLIDNEVVVIDNLSFNSPATKGFTELLSVCSIDRSCLVALRPDNRNARLAARNVDFVTVCAAHELTCFNLLNHRKLMIAKSDLEAWLGGPSSRTDKTFRQRAVAEASS